MGKKSNIKADFTKRLLGLISEPDFVRFINIFSEPNIFKILGRTHYERWHSAFLGWLLDVNGSHLLGDYVLTRFLYLLLNEKTLKPINENEYSFLKVIPVLEFSDFNVIPNENNSTELNIANLGRFDIFLTCTYYDKINDVSKKLNIIFELKNFCIKNKCIIKTLSINLTEN